MADFSLPSGFDLDAVCVKLMAKPCRNAPSADEDMKQFVAAMWTAFPQARSENELAALVAAHLNRERRQVSSRTVRYWLRQATSPHYRYVTRVLSMIDDDRTLLNIVRGRR